MALINVASGGSCLIDEGTTFLVTGGGDFLRTASRYDIHGWQEDLDPMNEARYFHGCSQFTNNQGEKVRMFLSLS